jgi:hypothetical protein
MKTIDDVRKYLAPIDIDVVVYHKKCCDGYGGF